jgi:hypothetical protein
LKGTTLVVGGRVNEVPLAREVAYWLSHLTGMARPGIVSASESVLDGSAAESGPSESSPKAPPTEGRFPLARRPDGNADITLAQAWDGPPQGPSLRRAARLADRVLVIIASGTLSVTEVAQLRSRLGRKDGIGVLVVGLNPELITLPDRVGDVDAFWRPRSA